MRLVDNKDVRKEITKKNVDVLYRNASKREKNRIVNQIMNDTKKLDLHKRALALFERQKAKHKIVEDLSKEYKEITGKELDKNGLQRMAYVQMDVSGTPEAKKKNMDYLISLSDVNFARKEAGRIINEIRKFDASKVVFQTPEEGLALAEENFDLYYYMFCSIDIFHNKTFDFDPKTNEYINNLRAQVQQGGNVVGNLNILASNVYITTPDMKSSTLVPKARGISKNFIPYEGIIDNIKVTPNKGQDLESTAIINSTTTIEYCIDQMKKLPELFDNNTIPKDLCNNICKINEEKKTLSEGVDALIEKKTGVRFEKMPDDVLTAVENDLNNPALVGTEKSSEYLINEFYAKKLTMEEEVKEMMDLNGITADVSEEILNVYKAAKVALNTDDAKNNFDATYKKNFSSAFDKIYKNIILENSKIGLLEVDGMLVPEMKSSEEVHYTTKLTLENFDKLMQDIVKKGLDENPSKDKLVFDEKTHVLAGLNPKQLAEGVKSLINENAVKSYLDHFENEASVGLTGAAKYAADSAKIFANVSKLKKSVISYDEKKMATQEQKDLSNVCELAIGKLEKDAASIYALMRQEHRSHNFLWRWFKGGESRAQLKAYKENYCRVFDVNKKTATDHILDLANGLGTVGVYHNHVTDKLIENEDLLNYQKQTITKLNDLPSLVNADEFKVGKEEMNLFDDLDVEEIKHVDENALNDDFIDLIKE